MSESDRMAAAVARVFVTDARPWEQLLDDAAAIIGEPDDELCLIGVAASTSEVFAPIGVYHAEPDRLTRINGTPGFSWPVSDRASLVMTSGLPSFSDGSPNMPERADPEIWAPWNLALQGLQPLANMMLAIQFAGVSVGAVVVGRPPGRPYTEADARELGDVVDVLALSLQGFRIRADELPEGYVASRMTRASIAMLTGRERRIVVLLAEGLTNAEIGAGMHLSERTIEWYRARILEKLDHPTRSELVAVGRNVRG